MVSRLILLSCARELAAEMEEAGVLAGVISNWNGAVISAILRPCHGIEQGRVLETELAGLFREAARHLRTVTT